MTRRAISARPYVTVVKASGVRIESRPSPSYTGSGTKDMVLLRPITCTGVHQRQGLAKIHMSVLYFKSNDQKP